METTDLVNIYGLAAALRLPRDWLMAEADAGRIPALRIGRNKTRFNVRAVRLALAERAASAHIEVTYDK